MIRTILAAAALLLPTQISAQEPQDTAITSEVRAEVIASLSEAMRETYVFPDVAEEVAAELSKRRERGDYAELDTAQSFAAKLHEDLREIGNDRHLRFEYAPGFQGIQQPDNEPSSEEMAQQVAEEARWSAGFVYGLPRVSRLPGNIGYIDIRAFLRAEFASEAYKSAIHLVTGSDALIIDLRANMGGDPGGVTELISHFFPYGDQRQLTSIYFRPEDRTQQYWTNQAVQKRYEKPIYLLTSPFTFSAGEAFAYDMQALERATLIGEVTGGGANPGGPVPLAHGFAAFISFARAINPITGTNWEHVGVKPDIATSADDAISTAYRMALEERLSEADDMQKQEIEALLQRADAGELNLPAWEDPRAQAR